MAGVLFDDLFAVKDVDPDGKKFDRVSRFHCHSESFKMDMLIDVNTQIYPLEMNDKFRLILCTTLNEDGTEHESSYTIRTDYTRLRQYEYVMLNRVLLASIL